LWAAKIWDPRFGGDARAGQRYNTARLRNPFAGSREPIVHGTHSTKTSKQKIPAAAEKDWLLEAFGG